MSANFYSIKKSTNYMLIKQMGIDAGLEKGDIGPVVQAWVALSNKSTIGGIMLLSTHYKDVYTIEWLSVKKAHRKKGIGSALVKKCLEYTKQHKIKKIIISMQIPTFFKKFGFHLVSSENVPKEFTCFDCPRYNQSCFPVVMVIDLSNSTT